MNNTDKILDQIRLNLKHSIVGKTTVHSIGQLFDEYMKVDSVQSIKNQHDNKNCIEKLIDWIKWKTPLSNIFKYKWQLVKGITNEDKYKIYDQFLNFGPQYIRVVRGKIYKKIILSSPYDTWDIKFLLPMPVNYIKCEFTIGDKKHGG